MRRPKIEPVVWKAPKVDPASRPPRNSLPPLTLLRINGIGPEDVLVDEKGHVFTGVEDGRILRLTPDGRRLDTIADTGGRPLGLEFHPDGRLLVCDAYRGLLLIERASGEIEVLIEGGADMRLCNNAAVATDGTIYFTDSSARFDLKNYMADVFEHSGTGRLLRRDPDGTVATVLSGLQFANGVALTPDESAVIVAQTTSYQLDKVWLTGERAGAHEVLADNLPGFPDNLSTGSDGLIWIAMATPRDPTLDFAHARHPMLRKLIHAMPENIRPKEKKTAWARAIDGASGKVVHDYFGKPAEFYMATGIRERDGRVYLGSLHTRAIGVFDLPS